MPTVLWPITNSAKRKIEKSVENHQELYWQRSRRSEIQLRAVTYTYENGHFKSKCLWMFSDVTDEDLDDIRRLQIAVMSLYSEHYKNLGPIGLDEIVSNMFFDGVVSRTLSSSMKRTE